MYTVRDDCIDIWTGHIEVRLGKTQTLTDRFLVNYVFQSIVKKVIKRANVQSTVRLI
jgi:hypothetical protein